MNATETLGRALGVVLAPLTAAGSLVRRARLFHPDGVVYRAEVTPLGNRVSSAAERLAGPALVRLSNAWWKGGKEWPDILGVAIRFRGTADITPMPGPGDQDLLLATMRSAWTLPFAPLTTNPHSFLSNDYHGALPFDVEGLGRAHLSLLSPQLPSDRRPRAEALEAAVTRGVVVFELWARLHGRGARIEPLVAVRLLERVSIDQEALRFDPFREGRGLSPRGFFQNVRRATYLASQWARPRTARDRGEPIPVGRRPSDSA
jgi:hypothetical protein